MNVLLHRAAGLSLIEVLVSILVLSVGVMGTLRMQLNSIQTAQQSGFYSTAMELASEMAEILRSNPAQLQQQLPIHFQSKKNSTEFAQTWDEPVSTEVSTWIKRIDMAIPNGRAVICRDSAPWDSDLGSLKWDCTSAGESSDTTTSIVIKLGWLERNDTEPTTVPPPRIAMAVFP